MRPILGRRPDRSPPGRRPMQQDLVRRAQGGDLDAFSVLTAHRTDRLYAAARLILRDDERAADAVQDSLLQAWLDIRGLRDPERFDAWLHRLLVRACYRAAKRQRTREIRRESAPPRRRPRQRPTPSEPSRCATSSSAASAACRPNSVRSSSCATTSGCLWPNVAEVLGHPYRHDAVPAQPGDAGDALRRSKVDDFDPSSSRWRWPDDRDPKHRP